MKNDIWSMLNESEQALLREIEPRKLRKLDEDELVAVHQRVRRARNKYSKNYRRGAAAQVAKDGGRGKVSARYSRTARKAEAFEDALARVSARLAKVAQESADQLKAERLAAARHQKATPAAERATRPSAKTSSATEKKKRRTPAGKRASAQARASNKRHQAKTASKTR